ncbi:uncharacterized protein LOC116433206 [Nomia melanderi]|uniref:uncharacterized protein LOC116433206 n=1 Tax=Nomia melanderi TaxID=2448451 RepID=UPI003FCE5B6B
MFATHPTSYALRLSFHQAGVTSSFRRHAIERNFPRSAFILATMGISLSMFSIRMMLSSKHRGRL